MSWSNERLKQSCCNLSWGARSISDLHPHALIWNNLDHSNNSFKIQSRVFSFWRMSLIIFCEMLVCLWQHSEPSNKLMLVTDDDWHWYCFVHIFTGTMRNLWWRLRGILLKPSVFFLFLWYFTLLFSWKWWKTTGAAVTQLATLLISSLTTLKCERVFFLSAKILWWDKIQSLKCSHYWGINYRTDKYRACSFLSALL